MFNRRGRSSSRCGSASRRRRRSARGRASRASTTSIGLPRAIRSRSSTSRVLRTPPRSDRRRRVEAGAPAADPPREDAAKSTQSRRGLAVDRTARACRSSRSCRRRSCPPPRGGRVHALAAPARTWLEISEATGRASSAATRTSRSLRARTGSDAHRAQEHHSFRFVQHAVEHRDSMPAPHRRRRRARPCARPGCGRRARASPRRCARRGGNDYGTSRPRLPPLVVDAQLMTGICAGFRACRPCASTATSASTVSRPTTRASCGLGPGALSTTSRRCSPRTPACAACRMIASWILTELLAS